MSMASAAETGCAVRSPEILAPAGTMACLQAALDNGADAVYIGTDAFNMRCGASASFPRCDIPEASERCRRAGARLYLTLNTIVFEDEIAAVDELVGEVCGVVDAAIVSDWAALKACRRHGLAAHASTQMSCSNSAAAGFLAEAGFSRIVLARECSLDEAARIAASTGVEIEMFVHGAMCVAVSGRCLMSHEAYGLSANRGECRQPCRKRYLVRESEPRSGDAAEFEVGGHTVFSARDLCSLPFLPELMKAGAAAFKIEGRARNPEYVAVVTDAYRTGRDAVLNGTFTPELSAKLTEQCRRVYNRGFGTGLYFGRPGADQFSADGASNLATETKSRIGIVTNYFAKPRVAEILLYSGGFYPGARLLVQGSTTGSVEICAEAPLMDGVPAAGPVPGGSTVTLECPVKVRRGDAVYMVAARV